MGLALGVMDYLLFFVLVGSLVVEPVMPLEPCVYDYQSELLDCPSLYLFGLTSR